MGSHYFQEFSNTAVTDICCARLTRLRTVVFLLSLIVLPGVQPAHAMSYVPMSDEALLNQADVVIVGTVAGASSGADADSVRYTVAVEEVLKGYVSGNALAVSVPGSIDPQRDGALVVPGAPRFGPGQRVLLFLSERGDGAYALAQLSLGAFRVEHTASGEQVLTRELSGADAVEPDVDAAKSAVSGGYRRLERFAAWLRARAAGQARDSDYWSEVQASDLVVGKFTLSGSPPVRWFEFDEGRSITFYAGGGGIAGVSGGGYQQLTQAISAWNRDAGSNIRLNYGGLTSASGGLGRADGVNAVLFNDPNNEIAGSYSCQNGGVLAMTYWRSSGSRKYNGRSFQSIVEVDIAVQNGAGCALSKYANSIASQLFTHELGHGLGLAHSCGDGLLACILGSLLDAAVMRPTIHSDARGATLGWDDQAGVASIYSTAASSTGDTSGSDTDAGDSGGSGGAFDRVSLLILLFALMLSASVRAMPFRRNPLPARLSCRRYP